MSKIANISYFITKLPEIILSKVNSTISSFKKNSSYALDALEIFKQFKELPFGVKNPKDLLIKEIQNCKEAQKNGEKITRLQNIPLPSQLHSKSHSKHEDQLKFNLQLAEELLLETLKVVPFSANNIDRSRKVLEESAKVHGIVLNNFSEIVCEARRLLRENRNLSYSESAKKTRSIFKDCKIGTKNTTNALVGNCWEMATVALFKGMEKGIWHIHLDRAYIYGGDHVFLVIGRQAGSNPNDYKTWGPSAVVLDTWAHKIYKVSEIETQLEDYFGVDDETGKPYLRPFNPKKQQLNIEVGNLCSTLDLLDFLKCNTMTNEEATIFRTVALKMDKFHEAKNLQEKLTQAKDIFNLCTKDVICSFRLIRMLKDQIKHFIKLNSKI